jgi:hypothetical protein
VSVYGKMGERKLVMIFFVFSLYGLVSIITSFVILTIFDNRIPKRLEGVLIDIGFAGVIILVVAGLLTAFLPSI